MFNVGKWKSDVKAIETEIRTVKQTIRTPGLNASSVLWSELHYLKGQATMMYQVRAQYRGKLHHKLIETLDEQLALISPLPWELYVSADPVVPVETVA